MKTRWEQSVGAPALRLATLLTVGLLLFGLVLKSTLEQLEVSPPLEEGAVVQSTAGSLQLVAHDLISEPGEIEDHAERNQFFARQNTLASILGSEPAVMTRNGTETPLKVGRRSLLALPFLFWVQVFVAFGSLAISGAIWALRPRELPNALFALGGFAVFLSALPSAVYTTRNGPIAVPTFQILEDMNAFGAALFGIVMLALFLVYPVRLKNWKAWVLVEYVVTGGWTILYLTQTTPPGYGLNLLILVAMLGLCALVGIQFWATRKNPKARASLVWLGLSVVAGAGAFVAFNTVPILLQAPPLHQGYAFTFFLLIYFGLAAGLLQYRLFDVGRWAFRFLFYTLGALLFILLDAGMIYLLGMDRSPALGVSLLAVGLIYLPLRDFFWTRLTRKFRTAPQELLGDALFVALAPSSGESASRWKSLLQRLFDPLEMVATSEEIARAEIQSDGLVLAIPAVANAPALKLSYPWSGKSLYSQESRDVAQQLISLIELAESSRESYNRGVIEERRRLSRDLHDDISARLLSGIANCDERHRPLLQSMLTDIRSILEETTVEDASLEAALRDLRQNCERQLADLGIALIWNGPEESSSVAVSLRSSRHKVLRSAFREIVSNVIRHSQATRFEVGIECRSDRLHMIFTDDGRGFSGNALSPNGPGHGLKNVRSRLLELGGHFEIEPLAQGCRLELALPY